MFVLVVVSIGRDTTAMLLATKTGDLSRSTTLCVDVKHRDLEKNLIIDSKSSTTTSNRSTFDVAEFFSTLDNALATGDYQTGFECVQCVTGFEQKNPLLVNMIAERCMGLSSYSLALHAYKELLVIFAEKTSSHTKGISLSNVHNNTALCLKALGLYSFAKEHFEVALAFGPAQPILLNNYGNLMNDMSQRDEAKEAFNKALELDPNDYRTLWNMHSLSEDNDEAKRLLERCIERNPSFSLGVTNLAGINAMMGDTDALDFLNESELRDDPIISSYNWLMTCSPFPEMKYNRWAIFDFAIDNAVPNRVCYEFGVWMGTSLKYLMKGFDSGFGFDTFSGLPEQWGYEEQGSYSSFGIIPKISNVEFVIGKFEETLEDFFSTERPIAGVINFDADLHSSTLCALINSHKVIDPHTLLIFDEMIGNENWQQDEFKALKDYCTIFNLQFEVIAASVFSKQVVVKVS